ncbi:MAG: lipopolysaccharide biosynthesis protein [Lachnospiraceae bacterium]|nr:lipopolysaccharide biosynthesis protein [Lachnospiraceae bacterium]
MEKKGINEKIVGGLIWTYAERMSSQIVSLIITIILARLLTPEEYGIVSIVTVFIVLADVFVVNGFGNALIQKKDADQIDFSTVFFFNILFSAGIYIVLFFLAEPIALFYEIEILIPVLRIMAIRIPIAGVNSIQQAYVSKKMDFKKFFFANIWGTVLSGMIGIVMAYCGMGVWALVAQNLSNTIIGTVVLWFTVKWRPKMVYSHERMKRLFNFGSKILASSLLIAIYSNVQDLIIGKKFSSQDLAYSNKGRQFPSLIATNINTSLTKVLFPAVAECQDDLQRVKHMTRKAISIGTYVLAPVLIGFAAVAVPFVEVLLTERWLPCVVYLRIMCMVYLLQPIQTASLQAMKALGKSDLYLKLEIIKKMVGIIILFVTVTAFDSVLAIIWGSLIVEIFSTIINIPVNKKLLGYNYLEQLADVGTSLIISIITGVIIYGIGLFQIDSLIALILQVVCGVILYVFISKITRNENYKYLENFLKIIIKKIRGR